MSSKRIVAGWLRIVVAMAFGFMNLAHGPVMAFAHAAKHGPPVTAALDRHEAGDTSHGHHHPAHHHDHGANHALNLTAASDGDAAHDGTPCNAFGCFISTGAASAPLPTLTGIVIGQLRPLPPDPGSPASAELADPPPRLHG